MSSNKELQKEELEVLRSIYEGDDKFKEISTSKFQYKFSSGEDNATTWFILEITWGTDYPECAPDINLDSFYNKHISNNAKAKIILDILNQTDTLLNSAMTFTLFERVKENHQQYVDVITSSKINDSDMSNIVSMDISKVVPLSIATTTTTTTTNEYSATSNDVAAAAGGKKEKPKKEQLTKAQKRRALNKLEPGGELARGWDWVDILSHLTKCGTSAV